MLPARDHDGMRSQVAGAVSGVMQGTVEPASVYYPIEQKGDCQDWLQAKRIDMEKRLW